MVVVVQVGKSAGVLKNVVNGRVNPRRAGLKNPGRCSPRGQACLLPVPEMLSASLRIAPGGLPEVSLYKILLSRASQRSRNDSAGSFLRRTSCKRPTMHSSTKRALSLLLYHQHSHLVCDSPLKSCSAFSSLTNQTTLPSINVDPVAFLPL